MESNKISACHEEDTAKQWELRAAATEFLAFSLSYPAPAHAEMLVNGQWLEAANDMASELHAPWSGSGWENELATGIDGLPTADSDALLRSLRAEATRLFVGAPNPLVSPYEGIWRAEEDGVKGLLFVNPHSMDVERFVKACGLGRPTGTNEPLDHVVTELELLSHLASCASENDTSEAIMPADIPEGSPGLAYRRFFREHPVTWLHSFAIELGRKTRLQYYRAVAALLEASLPVIDAS